jgi:hypothetical protein
MTGCTPFLVRMMTTSDEKLREADIRKVSEKYQVKMEWAEMCFRIWLRRK